jgi:hypothetical protein
MPEERDVMNDSKIYRWAGACALAIIVVFFVDFPLYIVRGPFPGVAE